MRQGKGLTGSRELSKAIKQQKVKVVKPENQELVKALLDPLGRGEAEAIALASSIKPAYIVLDDRLARIKAQNMGLNVIGTLRVLRLMYKRNVFPFETLLASINTLETIGFHISEQVIQELMEA
jgi:predicted nucleic acid-binding protein